ncbi:MAG: hypothetical protein ACOY31_12235 [Bacillota bacterium]
MRLFLKAIDRHKFSFLSQPGVVSIGVGYKFRRNYCTGVPSLTIGVSKKLPPGKVPRDQLIPDRIDHLPTDVVEVGRIRFLGFALPWFGDAPDDNADFRKQRVRPARPGVSIGHYRTTAGTFGAVVSGKFPGGLGILSNNHILANGTDGRDGLARVGDPVLQPAPYDDGGAGDVIARLYAFTKSVPEGRSGKGPINRYDAAIAVPISPDLVDSAVVGIGPVCATGRAYPGLPVLKSGRTSGVTGGSIFSVRNTIRVDGDNNRTYIYGDQIGFSAKSEGGDSGSLVVDRNGRAVGLLFAGSEHYTYANPIDGVLDYFGASLVCDRQGGMRPFFFPGLRKAI